MGIRHVDWIGACGDLKIISAPSPVMIPDEVDAQLYVHTLAIGPDGVLRLLQPDRLAVAAVLVRPRRQHSHRQNEGRDPDCRGTNSTEFVGLDK